MKFESLILFAIINLIFMTYSEAQQLPPAGYKLRWSDEFNGESLDSDAWGSGMKPWGTKDNSPCLIVPEDTYIEDGNLVLRCQSGNFGQYNYSCGWAWTKKWFKYGYFEMRAQYPKGKGQWPAWWMLKEGWPPEIDIAEYRGAPKNYMTQAFYWGNWSTNLLKENDGWDFTEWHTYALQWGPEYLIWYVDGKVTKYFYGNQVPSDSMYMIFSAGLDGSVADSTTGFPNYFKIDYISVYQYTDTSSCFPTPVIPNVQINFGSWQMTDSIYAKPGDYIGLAPYPSSGGTWIWSGAGLSGSSYPQYFIAHKSDTIVAKFVNTCGDTSTLIFHVMVKLTGIEKGSDIPDKYSLSQNYPNPFNPKTVISYSIPKDNKVTLKVFDILGREVATLVNEVKPAGTYKVNFNGKNLSSGVYIYSLITDEQIITRKLILVK